MEERFIMKKKAFIMLLCAALVITSAALGTIAYLTDRQAITNVFTVGNVQIKVDETDVDLNGDPIPDENGNPVRKEEGNEYHLVPGKAYTKDPAVTVLKGTEDTYVRMLVTLTDAADINAVFDQLRAAYPAEDFSTEKFITGWDKALWPLYEVRPDAVKNQVVYEFRFHQVVAADPTQDQMLPILFQGFTLPGQMNGQQLELIKDAQIIVEGHAIQVATFLTADDAWAAFDAQEVAENPDDSTSGITVVPNPAP